MRIKRRNGLVSALLGLVTCGLYHIFFWYQYGEDTNWVCRDDRKMTQNYIFAIYKGCLPTDEKRIFNHILMFNHNGKLLRNFRVTNNDSLGKIEVSEDERTIYVSCYEPEPAILRIDISEYV